MTFASDVMVVQNHLNALFNEALQTYGPGATMAAVTGFAASALHHAEHQVNDPQARAIVLGRWTEHFHAYLSMLNQQCDDDQKRPEGMA